MLHVFEPNITQADIAAVTRTLASGRISPGERVAEFEAMLCAETGAKHAICCNSGTTALMLVLHEDTGFCSHKYPHVNVPSYGIVAAANAAALCGRDVRTIPIDPRTLCVPDYPDFGNTVVVSHNGNVAARDALAESKGDYVHLHDAATSLGMLKLREVDTAILSFSSAKIVTTGQGGAVLTNNRWIAEQVRRLIDHGGGDWRKTRVHEAIGGNFRMADLNAALGISQMQRLPELLRIRRERFAWYREHFPCMPTDGWCALVRSTKAKDCIAALAEAGYEALQPYRPIQENKPYRDNPVDPEAVKAADELLYLPVHWKASQDDINTICQTILKVDACAHGN